jgi:hypothetical protein
MFMTAIIAIVEFFRDALEQRREAHRTYFLGDE